MIVKRKNEARFQLMESQLSNLNSTVEQLPQLLRAAQSHHTLANPPHPGSLPQPCFPSDASAITARPARAAFNQEQLKTIKDVVNKAKFIVGF